MRYIKAMLVAMILMGSSAEASVGDEIRTTLCVLDPSSRRGIPPSLVQEIYQIITSESTRSGKFDLMDRERRDALLAGSPYQNVSCAEEKCAFEIGRLLKVQRVLFGKIERDFRRYLLELSVVDIKSGAVIVAETGEFAGSRGNRETVVRQLIRSISAKKTVYLDQADSTEVWERIFGKSQDSAGDTSKTWEPRGVDGRPLPPFHHISEMASFPVQFIFDDSFGMYAVLAYYKVLPDMEEYRARSGLSKWLPDPTVSDLTSRGWTSHEIHRLEFEYYAELAREHGLHVYRIRNCSVGAIRALVANDIPVFVGGPFIERIEREVRGVIEGYEGLSYGRGSLIFFYRNATVTARKLATYRLVAMIAVPKPSAYKGHTREELAYLITSYRDHRGKKPRIEDMPLPNKPTKME